MTSGSHIALRINFRDPQGIKLREFWQPSLQRQYTGKVEWVLFMRVSEN